MLIATRRFESVRGTRPQNKLKVCAVVLRAEGCVALTCRTARLSGGAVSTTARSADFGWVRMLPRERVGRSGELAGHRRARPLRVLGARGSTNGGRGLPVGTGRLPAQPFYSKSRFNRSGGGCCTYGASNMSQEAHLKCFNLIEVFRWPAGSDRDRAHEARTSTRFARLGSGAPSESRDPQIELLRFT